MEEIILNDGKYRFYERDGLLFCDRYGNPWRDFIGDKAVFSLFDKCLEMRQQIKALLIKKEYRHGEK